MDFLEKLISDIKSLKIQGASNIVKHIKLAIIKAIDLGISKRELIKFLYKAWKARPTEPDLRTFILHFYDFLLNNSLQKAKRYVMEDLKRKEKARSKIAKNFMSFIDSEIIVFTHCHSHTVEYIVKSLFDNGLLKYVINTESRPVYQGRITAKAFAEYGIKVKHIVDSAANIFMDEADCFVTGCDSILADGSIINKIGTSSISNIAYRYMKPHYVCTSIYKFDPLSFFSNECNLERRDPKEVWDYENKNLEIINLAFDKTDSYLVKCFFTEEGIFEPYKISEKFMQIESLQSFIELFNNFKEGHI